GAKEVVPESKEISLKFANGFNSTGQPTRDKIKIMQTKVGDTKDIKNFEVENSPNSVKIKFAGDLESCADYKILFDESVKTVFGQEVSDYTFKTTGKKGMSYIKDFTFYDENDKVVNIDRIQANIAYTTITYDQPMDEGSLKNVKIDGADFNSTYNGENFTQTLTFNKALEPFKTYTIFADNNVVSSNGQQLENYKQEVTPVVGKYKIQTAVKQNNTEITRGR
ncbi:MAG: hypothetical protein RR957_08310, partial [Oscillospiraceae bacterium]